MTSSRKFLFDIYDVQDILLPALLCLCFCCYVKFLWNIKHLLIKSWNHPGPFNLPLIGGAYHLICRKEHILDRCTQLQEKYPMGIKIWMGYKLFYFLHEPEHIRKILGSSKFVTKENIFYGGFKITNKEGLLAASPETWKKHRKIIEPSYNQQILNSFVEVFARNSLVLNKTLAENCGRELDIQNILARCLFDTNCESAMGVKTDDQRGSSNYAHVISRMLHCWSIKMLTLWYHIQIVWRIFGPKRETEAYVKKLKDFCDQILHQKRKTSDKKQLSSASDIEVPLKRLPFLDHIIGSGQFSEEQLIEEIGTTLFAATDTISVALSFVFTVLGMFPDIQQKVYEEVIQILGNDRSPEFTDLPQMLYTERVIKETLRLFPVAPIFLRAVTEDVDMGEFVVPKDTTAFFGLIFIHRNPKYWPNPLKFDPDRFLPEEVDNRHPCTYMPFSFGPRNCIGRTYGMMNMKVILAIVIRKYVFHSGYKRIEDIKIKFDFLLNFEDGAKVSITPRQ